MSYRFLKMTSVYPEFAADFTSRDPDLGTLPYEEIHRRLLATRYGLSDFYGRHMQRLGNESWEVFATLEVLQRAWARGRGMDVAKKSWMRQIAVAQVEQLKPDVIFLQDLFLFDEDFRAALRSAAPRHALVVGWRSSPTTDFASFADLDLILSAFPHFVDRWRSIGVNARLLPLAFEPSILDEVELGHRDLPFTFVGQVGAPHGPHAERKRLIEMLAGSTLLEVFGGVSVEPRGFVRTLIEAVSTRSPKAILPSRPRFAVPDDRLHPALFGLDYYAVMGRSQITLNHHSEQASGPHASNLRLYEATGMGACLLTDSRVDLDMYFDVGNEVVTYEDERDAVEKVSYLLDHPSEREAIAASGQRRTLQDHNYEKRVEQLDGWLKELLAGKDGGL